MGSNTSRQVYRSSRLRCVSVIREWFQHVSRPHETILSKQFRTRYAMNLAGEQKSGVHSAVGFCRCRSRHRGGSKPISGQPVIHMEIISVSLDGLPSWLRGELGRFHYPALDVGYCPGFPATRTVPRRPSCGQSCLELAVVLSPIVKVLGRHHIPCKHE